MIKDSKEMNGLVSSLLQSYEKYPIISSIDSSSRINREVILEILEELRWLVFPGYFEMRHLKSGALSYHVGEILENVQYNLSKQVVRACIMTRSGCPGAGGGKGAGGRDCAGVSFQTAEGAGDSGHRRAGRL